MKENSHTDYGFKSSTYSPKKFCNYLSVYVHNLKIVGTIYFHEHVLSTTDGLSWSLHFIFRDVVLVEKAS